MVADDDRTDRRRFFKVAGAAAVGAIAGGVATAPPAAADTGDNLEIGWPNTATEGWDTKLWTSGSEGLFHNVLGITNRSGLVSAYYPPDDEHTTVLATMTDFRPERTGYGTALWARLVSSTPSGTGLFATANGPLNPRPPYSVGVCGTAASGGDGVTGICNGTATSFGVRGRSDVGVGVVGQSGGIDIQARGSGRILQNPAGRGAPTSGTFALGEQIRDTNGDLYLCTGAGSPGTWRKVVALHPNFASAGGSINFLSSPIRVLDTRGGAPIGGPKFAPSDSREYKVTALDVGGISVPEGAKAILANLTCADTTGKGFLVAHPSGVPAPATSAINYVAGVNVANALFCGLSPSGSLRITCRYAAAHVILDIQGFVF